MQNRKVRILFLSNRGLFPVKDGHTRRSSTILKYLSKNSSIYFLSLYESKEQIEKENINKLYRYCDVVEFFRAPKKSISFQMVIRLIWSFFH